MYVIIMLWIPHFVNAQEEPKKTKKTELKQIKKDTTKADKVIFKKEPTNKKEKEDITIKDYKIISYYRDTTFLDTTLTIKKEYKHNYWRKDLFESLPFSNIGQIHNELAKKIKDRVVPSLGASARNQAYLEKEDIKYYNVPTPTTDLFFKTTLEQGQLLDALLTLNTSKQSNISLAYKGLKSLGKYQHIQSNNGHFRWTANYETKNKKYKFRAHFVSQVMESEENGGILDQEQFESGEEEFEDRSFISVRYTDASNNLEGKRYFWDQEYKLTSAKDTLSKTSLFLGTEFSYETKFYQFNQKKANKDFGESFLENIIFDKSRLQNFDNQYYVKISSIYLGNLKASVHHYNYNYFFNRSLRTSSGIIPHKMKGNDLGMGLVWKKNIKNLSIYMQAIKSLNASQLGDVLRGKLYYQINEDNTIGIHIDMAEKMPNYNFQLYQSDYIHYNWFLPNLKREQTKAVGVHFQSALWGDLNIWYNTLDNYSYFRANNATGPEGQVSSISPSQSDFTIQYLKLKYHKSFIVGKFSSDHTIMYQNVAQDKPIYNVPDWTIRSSLVFSTDLFKKAMFLQVGTTFKYFTSYFADSYHPLLGELYPQNQKKIGAFPLLDFFINAKVRQTRLFLKAEHFNSSFMGNNFYSAPNYPYRDFIVRFGLVWNFFS